MGLWQKTMFYLGLVDEDSVGYDEVDEPQPRREASRPAPQRQAPRQQAPAPRRTPQEQEPRRPLRSGSAEYSQETEQVPPRQEQTGPRRATGMSAADGRSPDQVIRGGYPTVAGRRVEPPMSGRRRPATDRALSEAGVVVQPADRPLVRTMTDTDLESQVIVAKSYNDAQVLADHIRANIPVVLDLRKVEPAKVRRLVDFSSGLTYALGGSMRKIGQGVVLVTPANVNLTRDERRRLKDLGYYQAPEE